jgi:collagenase-like PrtC family protease
MMYQRKVNAYTTSDAELCRIAPAESSAFRVVNSHQCSIYTAAEVTSLP